jgi:hypothetical protein
LQPVDAGVDGFRYALRSGWALLTDVLDNPGEIIRSFRRPPKFH